MAKPRKALTVMNYANLVANQFREMQRSVRIVGNRCRGERPPALESL